MPSNLDNQQPIKLKITKQKLLGIYFYFSANIKIIYKLQWWSHWKFLQFNKSYAILFLKRCNKSDTIWSLRVSFMISMKYASNMLRASFLCVALEMTFQLKVWLLFSIKCLNGLDLSRGVLCSLHLVSTVLIVSPI